MRVRLLKKHSLYWNYAVQELHQGLEAIGDLARHLRDNSPEGTVEVLEDDPESEAPAGGQEPPEGDGEKPPAPVGDGPPVDGTAGDVMDWVGDDKDRAAQALAAEQAKDKPRATLVKRLDALAQ